MIFTNIQLGTTTPPGSPFTANRYIDAGAFKLTFTGTGITGIETSGTGIKITDGRSQNDKGANITAANDLTLGVDGNTFTVTGNTTINAITSTNWQNGSWVILETTGTPLFKHNTAGGAGTLPLKLAGSVDFQAAVDDAILFYNNGSFWHELARKQAAGTITADEGLTMFTPTNVRLFGSLATPALLTTDRYLTAAAQSLNITANTLAGGNVLAITATTTSSLTGSKVISITRSGASATGSQTTWGLHVVNSQSGTTPVNNAILGEINNSTGAGAAVTGRANGDGSGVSGIAGTGNAVQGSTTSGTGGSFSSSSGAGVFALSTSGTGLSVQTSTGLGAQILIVPATTNTIANVLRLNRQSSGTPAAGIGGQIEFYNETDSSANVSASIAATWSDVANSTRSATLRHFLTATALVEERYSIFPHKALTESSATAFVRVNIPSGSVTGGEIIITVEANDTTDFQARTLRFIWSAVNKGGTITANVQTPEESVAVSAGTLTVTIDTNDAGSGNLDFRANAVSSLTQTVLRCSYQVFKNIGTGVITPQ